MATLGKGRRRQVWYLLRLKLRAGELRLHQEVRQGVGGRDTAHIPLSTTAIKLESGVIVDVGVSGSGPLFPPTLLVSVRASEARYTKEGNE